MPNDIEVCRISRFQEDSEESPSAIGGYGGRAREILTLGGAIFEWPPSLHQ